MIRVIGSSGSVNTGRFLTGADLTAKSRVAGVYPWWKIVAAFRPVRIVQTVLCCRSKDRPFTCPIPYSEGHLFHGQGPLVILYTQITLTYNAKHYTHTTNVLLYFSKWQAVHEFQGTSFVTKRDRMSKTLNFFSIVFYVSSEVEGSALCSCCLILYVWTTWQV
jgi:hypothetical protein